MYLFAALVVIAHILRLRYSTIMDPTHNKKSIARTLYIIAIIILTAAVVGLVYYSFTLQQDLSKQRTDMKKLSQQVETLKKESLVKPQATTEEAAATSPEETTVPTISEDDAILAAASQFMAANGISATSTPQITDKYSNFADVSIGYAGLILKNTNNSWNVVSHGQQLNLNDVRTHGIPIDTSSAFYQSLTPAERQGIVTR